MDVILVIFLMHVGLVGVVNQLMALHTHQFLPHAHIRGACHVRAIAVEVVTDIHVLLPALRDDVAGSEAGRLLALIAAVAQLGGCDGGRVSHLTTAHIVMRSLVIYQTPLPTSPIGRVIILLQTLRALRRFPLILLEISIFPELLIDLIVSGIVDMEVPIVLSLVDSLLGIDGGEGDLFGLGVEGEERDMPFVPLVIPLALLVELE